LARGDAKTPMVVEVDTETPTTVIPSAIGIEI
jgi:hypothetical protein